MTGSCSNVVPLRPGVSPRKEADKGPAFVSGLGWAVLSSLPKGRVLQIYGRAADDWMAFCHAFFADPSEVQVVFRVSARAAEKWWQGVGGARVDKMMVALHLPGAAAWWADRLALKDGGALIARAA